MIFPLPPMAMPSGPPTAYANSRRCEMIVVLVCQSVLCLLRTTILLDILGGFIMLICIGFGIYAYMDNMNTILTCYWGLMCAFQGVFDFVKLIDYLVKTSYPLLGFLESVVGILHLGVIVSFLYGAWLTWRIYKSHTDGDSHRLDEERPIVPQDPDRGNQSAPAVFQGAGNRLGY